MLKFSTSEQEQRKATDKLIRINLQRLCTISDNSLVNNRNKMQDKLAMALFRNDAEEHLISTNEDIRWQV